MALDLSGPKEPPPSRPRKPSAPRISSSKTQEREEGLNGIFQLASAGLLMASQPADAAAVATHGPNIARESATLAESNERMGKLLDYLTAVGPFAGLLTACMPLVLQILVNHNRLPMVPVLASMGVQDPKALEAESKANAMRQVIEMQRQQAEAEAELARMMAEQSIKENAQANGRPTPTDITLRS